MRSFYCKSRLNREKGFSLVELMFSIFLGSLVCIVLGKFMYGTVKFHQAVMKRYSYNLAEVQVVERVQKILNDLDTYPFFIFPRVHKNGRITLKNGKDIKRLSNNLQPNNESDAITGISLGLEYSYKVLRQEKNFIYACPQFKKTSLEDLNFGFIAVGVDGFWEVQTTSINYGTGNGCIQLNYYIPESMLVQQNVGSEQYITLLVPILSYYTLYVDNNEQVRYLSHRGSEIVENQPLFKNVKWLKISKKIRWNSIVCLSVETWFSNDTVKSYQNCNRLGRYDYVNFIMNGV